jgi:IS30 family transposase
VWIRRTPGSHKIPGKRAQKTSQEGSRIPNRVDIAERPETVEQRKQAGHGEVDTVVSRQGKSYVAVLVEREMRFFIVIQLDKTSCAMHKALKRALTKRPRQLRRTLTYDNGLENAMHEITNNDKGTKSYFCKPYHRWEKGSIENRNGILRRYFPKKFN